MKLASCCSDTRNPIDVMKACTGLAVVNMTTAGLMIKMMMMMWGTLLVTYSAGSTAVRTYIQVGDLSAIDVQVTGHFPATAAVIPVIRCQSGSGFRQHTQFFPSTTANCSLE
jgi:hypothetical protein